MLWLLYEWERRDLSIPDFLGAFYFYKTEALQTRDGRDICTEVCEVGNLVLTSGKIVACDGLIPSTEPFIETVHPGSYPVVLSIAQIYGWPQVACAMIRLSDKMPTIWKQATLLDQSQTVKYEGDVIGYGVDCGVGCFADVDAMNILLARAELYDQLTIQVHNPHSTWVDFCVNEETRSNIIVFSSGYGDGTYPTYIGYDRDANPLCYATDFGIIAPLLGEEAEKPSKDQLMLDFSV